MPRSRKSARTPPPSPTPAEELTAYHRRQAQRTQEILDQLKSATAIFDGARPTKKTTYENGAHVTVRSWGQEVADASNDLRQLTAERVEKEMGTPPTPEQLASYRADRIIAICRHVADRAGPAKDGEMSEWYGRPCAESLIRYALEVNGRAAIVQELELLHPDAYREVAEDIDYNLGWLVEKCVRAPAQQRVDELQRELEIFRGEIHARRYGRPVLIAGVKGQPPSTPDASEGLVLISGGFSYGGLPYDLTGHPLHMLQALIAAHHHRCSLGQLRDALKVDDAHVEFPDQVVKDTAKKLKNALAIAVKTTHPSSELNPISSTGKGADLTYKLNLP